MKDIFTKSIIATVILVFLVLGLSACTTNPVAPGNGNSGRGPNTLKFNPNANIQTQTFKSESEYKTFLRNLDNSPSMLDASRNMGASNIMYKETATVNSLANLAAVPRATSGAAGLTNDYSGTNNQVQGVDEGDILKTDGNYIYTITDKTLFIVYAYPAENATTVSEIKFNDTPHGLFVEGNKLAVFGRLQDISKFTKEGIRIRNGMTFLKVYDISDKSNPILIKEYDFEGNYLDSRMTGGEVYLLTNTYPEFREGPITPIIVNDGTVTNTKVSDIHYFNIPYSNPTLVGIHTINLENNNLDDSQQVAVEGRPTLYMSNSNIYLSYIKRINSWKITQDSVKEVLEPLMPSYYKDLIVKINNVDPEVLSKSEKERKVDQLYYEYMNGLTQDEQQNLQDEVQNITRKKLNSYKYFEYTTLNRIAVNNGKITVSANGKVPGHIMNQFSMDEYKHVLRIGTTISPRWNSQYSNRTSSSNNVYTLDQNLNQLGSIEGLAKGESIYSTRFMGDRLYMVTFKRADPFFVIDLSNPEKPKTLGQLKIPGFSRYLQAYDENTIIGLGRDATNTGRQTGLKISLFDVTDVANPKEIAKYALDNRYASSTAEWEHKAFLFSKEKNLLVIPVYSYNFEPRPVPMIPVDTGVAVADKIAPYMENTNYNGAFVFNISKDGIELRGLIDHNKDENRYYGPLVERSLYINNMLYTKSPHLLRINLLDTLEAVKDIKLSTTNKGNIPVY